MERKTVALADDLTNYTRGKVEGEKHEKQCAKVNKDFPTNIITS